MHDFQEQSQVHGQSSKTMACRCVSAFVVIFHKTKYSKTLTEYGFCDIVKVDASLISRRGNDKKEVIALYSEMGQN